MGDDIVRRQGPGPRGVGLIEGFLNNQMLESKCKGKVSKIATMSVYTGTGDDWGDSGETRIVTNRDDSLSGVSGQYIIAAPINGEYRPVWLGCDPPTSSGDSC